MQRRYRWCATLAVAALALAGSPAPVAANAAGETLSVIKLATWGRGGYVHDVNRSGLILGALNDAASNPQPVLWWDYDSPRALGIVGFNMVLNNLGHVAGIDGESTGASWLWRPGHVSYLRSEGRVWVTDVNDHDQVVGDFETTGAEPATAFVWQHGRFTVLRAPMGMRCSAWQVNNRGEVLGQFANADWSRREGFVWRDGVMTILRGPTGGSVEPIDINDRGQVLVSAEMPGSDTHQLFLWQQGRVVTSLAIPPGERAWVSDMNNHGDAVGSVGGSRAVLWRAGRMIDLGVLGSAERINDRGDVAGTSLFLNEDDNLEARIFHWRDGRLRFSEPMIGSEVGAAVAGIDERGRVVGHVEDGRGGGYIAVWLAS